MSGALSGHFDSDYARSLNGGANAMVLSVRDDILSYICRDFDGGGAMVIGAPAWLDDRPHAAKARRAWPSMRDEIHMR